MRRTLQDLEAAVRQDPEFPEIIAYTSRTKNNTPYLTEPGVALLTKPHTHVGNSSEFLNGYDPQLEFYRYLGDNPDRLDDGARICKFAGQLCYMSFGPKRTWNSDGRKYFDNILSSGHGSVMEHAYYGFLLYGISRSNTHELVRHRVGVGFSQVSQRYVNGNTLRFVERPEDAEDPELHTMFEDRIDAAALAYERKAQILLDRQGQDFAGILEAETRTEARKKVNQSARSLLPNETEAPIVMTANARTWRHIIEMRANQHAEVEIRELAFRIYLILSVIEPLLFGDYKTIVLPDGTNAVSTDYRKV